MVEELVVVVEVVEEGVVEMVMVGWLHHQGS